MLQYHVLRVLVLHGNAHNLAKLPLGLLLENNFKVNMNDAFQELWNFVNYTNGTNFSNIAEFSNTSQTLNISMLRHILQSHFFDTSLELEVIILVAIYVPIFLLGVLGNGIIILIIFSRPQLRNITNLFLWNLALADIAGK